MDYLLTEQYTSNSVIVELPGNDYLSHRETFDVDYNGKKATITYCHKAHGTQSPEPYSKFFNSFLNVNARFIRPNSLAVDIGAYDGDTTLPIAFLAGRALAFECSPSFSSQLLINEGFNPTLGIVPFPFAVMPVAGIHEFLYCPTDYNGGCAMTNSWVGTYTVPRFVRAINFEEFLKSRINFADISFVKTDTEGHDFHILWSFRDILRDVRPVIHSEWFPSTDNYIRQLISYLDYRVYCGFTLEPIVIGQSPWRQDIVLVPSDRVSELKLS